MSFLVHLAWYSETVLQLFGVHLDTLFRESMWSLQSWNQFHVRESVVDLHWFETFGVGRPFPLVVDRGLYLVLKVTQSLPDLSPPLSSSPQKCTKLVERSVHGVQQELVISERAPGGDESLCEPDQPGRVPAPHRRAARHRRLLHGLVLRVSLFTYRPADPPQSCLVHQLRGTWTALARSLKAHDFWNRPNNFPGETTGTLEGCSSFGCWALGNHVCWAGKANVMFEHGCLCLDSWSATKWRRRSSLGTFSRSCSWRSSRPSSWGSASCSCCSGSASLCSDSGVCVQWWVV